jgi:hypothetical protein
MTSEKQDLQSRKLIIRAVQTGRQRHSNKKKKRKSSKDRTLFSSTKVPEHNEYATTERITSEWDFILVAKASIIVDSSWLASWVASRSF